MSGWIGVDLDGTLAKYDGWVSPAFIGEPIPAMVERVKAWLAEGKQVKIMTARVSKDQGENLELARRAIEQWCLKHIGQVLEVTNEKDFSMVELWDDRCVQVVPNVGVPINERLDITCRAFKAIADHLKGGGTFRYLIYDRLRFGSEAYIPLYEAGGMAISNFANEVTCFAQTIHEHIYASQGEAKRDGEDERP